MKRYFGPMILAIGICALGCGAAGNGAKAADRESQNLAGRDDADEGQDAETSTPSPDPKQAKLDVQLMEAVEDGEWMEVIVLLTKGADRQMILGHEGFSMLHMASLESDLDVLEEVIEADEEDIDGTTATGATSLHLAVWAGNHDCVLRLLEAGADPFLADNDGWGVLHWAAVTGDLEMLEFLMLERKIKIPKPVDGTSPVLVLAVQSGELDVIKFLVKNGAKVAVVDDEGQTPLHHAAEGNYLDIATFLLSKGAKAEVKDASGATPLHLLAANCPDDQVCIDLAKLLVKKGAKKATVDHEGQTAHDLAATGMDEDLIEFLSLGE